MSDSPPQEYYQELAGKKRDFPALIITSQDSAIVYTHFGTGPKYSEIFKAFETFHNHPLGTSLLASLSDNDRTALQNWLDILYDETYVELMMPEDIVKLCPSFSLTWTDSQNYEIRFEAIKTENIYEYVLVWLEPHRQTQQQQLAAKIIELMGELRTAPREVMNNLREYLPEVSANIHLSNYADIDDSEKFLNQLSRHLHAAKGTIFFLGFNTLGDACHDAESKLEELRGSWQLKDGLQPIQEAFSQLYLILNLAEGISTKVYNTTAQADEEQLVISQAEYYQVVDIVTGIHEQSKSLPAKARKLTDLVETLYHGVIRFDSVDLANLFERLNSSTSQLSKELEKSAMFSIAGHPPTVYLPNRLFDSLWNALYQVLKNALDHGIEPASLRKEQGKPKVAKIVFSVEVETGNLILRLHDDGQGIDPQTVIQTALNHQLISTKEANRLETSATPAEVYALLFSSGFTTQTDVSTISGRGVGTNVIQEEVESYAGRISVASEVGQWTEFSLSVPIDPNHIVIENE